MEKTRAGRSHEPGSTTQMSLYEAARGNTDGVQGGRVKQSLGTMEYSNLNRSKAYSPISHPDLPNTDYIKAIHQYASDYYDQKDKYVQMMESMDATMLLAMGVMMEEYIDMKIRKTNLTIKMKGKQNQLRENNGDDIEEVEKDVIVEEDTQDGQVEDSNITAHEVHTQIDVNGQGGDLIEISDGPQTRKRKKRKVWEA